MRGRLPALALSLLLFSCGGSTAPDRPERLRQADGGSLENGSDDGAASDQGTGKKRSPKGGSGAPDVDMASPDDSSAPSGGGSGGGARSGAGSKAKNSTRPPAPGAYAYKQTGWEEVCQAGACDRRDLPGGQHLQLSRESAGGSRFRTESRGAGAQEQTISYRLGRRRLAIEFIRTDFSFGAFSDRTEIAPEPAIVSARLPFKVGRGWSGRWRDRNGQVDGDYSFEVRGRERVVAAGAEHDVFVVVVNMTFRGSFRGTQQMTLRVDPRDVTIVASEGRTEVRSDLGTYRSSFSRTLLSRP